MWIFELVHSSIVTDRITIKLKDVLRNVVVDLRGKTKILEKHDIHLADYLEAPSFLIRGRDLHAPDCGIQFISARHGAILEVIMRRV